VGRHPLPSEIPRVSPQQFCPHSEFADQG
jgi:hypothetical protein